MHRLSPLCALLALASACVSQNLAVSDGGNVSYTWNGANSVIGGGPGQFTADLAAGNQMRTSHWCYSIDGTAVGQVIDANGNGGFSVGLLGDLGICAIDDVDGLGRFDANWLASARSSGPRSGGVEHSLLIENIGTGTLSMQVYFLADFDAAGSALGDVVAGRSTFGDDVRLIVEDADSILELFGAGATSWQVDSVQSPVGPEERIAIGADLPNTTAGAPGDLIVALAWDLQIAFGQTREIEVTLGNNDLFVDAASFQLECTPAVGSDGGPVLDSAPVFLGAPSWDLTVTNAPVAATEATLLVKFGPIVVPPMQFGVRLLPNPEVVVPIALTEGVGSLSVPLACDPQLAGLRAMAQVVVADPNSPAEIPFGVSAILGLQLGD